jgi:putative transposase
MKRTRHTAEQIIRKLKTAEELIAHVKTVADFCRLIQVTQPPYHRWRQQYDRMQAEYAKRLTQLENENARPHKSVGSRAGDGDAQGSRRGKLLSPERHRRAVVALEERYRASARKVCRVVRQHRNTQHHPAKVVSIEDGNLRHRLRQNVAEHIRCGDFQERC